MNGGMEGSQGERETAGERGGDGGEKEGGGRQTEKYSDPEEHQSSNNMSGW